MIKNIFIIVCVAFAFTGCSSKPEVPAAENNSAPVKPGASIEAKQVAAQEETMYVAEIRFTKLSTLLTKVHKNQIQDALKEASLRGPVKNIRVLTWADAEYPSVHTKKLSEEDRDLVKKRNDAIKTYLNKSASGVDVELYSMAERPGLLKDIFKTTDSRLKKSLEIAGVPNTDTSVKTPSKASHSIVIVELK
ncbi:MAG: hypothetical protein H7328_05950 [Bdellovibrio sp.]|nr:hypothetical protein [Bdellovibrio sp.]